jgi:hypothetical protein
MYPCHYPGCKESFTNHTFLMNHILRDHGNSRVNWNQGVVAIIAALAIALALLRPANAQDAPAPQPTPTVGGGPQIAVEHKVFLPFVANGNDVKAAVSWCPSCSPRR